MSKINKKLDLRVPGVSQIKKKEDLNGPSMSKAKKEQDLRVPGVSQIKNEEDLSVIDYQTEGHEGDRESSLEPPSESDVSGTSYTLECEELIISKQYILNMAGFFSNSDAKVAASLSNTETAVYSLSKDTLKKECVLAAHTSTITNARFAPDKDSHLYTSSLDGTVKLWDLRSPSTFAQNFSGGNTLRPVTCFDLSCDSRLICAGTEVVGGTAFLVFWDLRSTKILGGYWNSHVEEITQVRFNPENKHCMVTGSMDGLINVFDIGKHCEDDALVDSLNTELSVDKLGWLQNNDSLYCLTHSNDLQVWKLSDSSPSVKFSSRRIADVLNMKYYDNLYTVDVHVDSTGNSFLLAGSSFGCGECLRTISLNNQLSNPRSLFGNNQVIRSSLYYEQNNILITGGEKGIISVWKPGDDKRSNKILNNKVKSQNQKIKFRRMKPY